MHRRAELNPNLRSATSGVDYYDRDAASFGERFDSTSFAEVHADWIAFLPSAGSPILDVGAGSGRDAVALEAMGYDVTAVEPSPRLREWAKLHHPRSEVAWLADSLPALQLVRDGCRRFSFILCSAVLMHLVTEDVEHSFRSLAELLTPSGVLAISLRDRQHFEPPAIFHDIGHATVLTAASRAGLFPIHWTETVDRQRRVKLIWRSYVFRK